jgi:phage-related protein
MPETVVVFFAADDGSCPLLRWLDELGEKIQIKCIVRIERLAEEGHELRRPEADTLRDGIHELRFRAGSVNYRVLYFFHERQAVVTHGFTKEGKVPDKEINLAIERMRRFKSDPDRHTHKE